VSIPVDQLPVVHPRPGKMHPHESLPLIFYNAVDLIRHIAGVQFHPLGGAILTPPIQTGAGGVVENFSLDRGMNLLNERKLSLRSSRKDGKSPAAYGVYACDNTSPLIHPSQRVASAAVSVLGTATDVAHELLQIGVSFLGFVPIPGLEPAARTLLQIWDTLQQVDVKLPLFSIFTPAYR
jgi:hypothetical protein